MDHQTDIRSWKVFRSLDSAFVANIRMAMVVGSGEAGIIQMRNDDVFSVGHGELLGIQGTSEAKAPVKVVEISGLRIKGICSGHQFVNVMTEDGQLFTWGSNRLGQLGLGQDIPSTHVPTRLCLPSAEPVVEVACGAYHTLAVTDSGKVYSWGSNPLGQVRKDLADQVWLPVDVLNEDALGRSKVISVACGFWSSFALGSNGHVWAWGENLLNGLSRTIWPAMVPLGVVVTKIVCGESNVLVLNKEGRLHFWGKMSPTKLFTQPTVVAAELGRVLDIAATWHSSLNVCHTISGVYYWGKWLGQGWKCPTASNFPSMDLTFAVDKGLRSDSIMCRSWVMQEDAGSPTSLFSDQFNTTPPADVQFKMRDGSLVLAHRRVLTSASPYFHEKFKEEWKDGYSPLVKPMMMCPRGRHRHAIKHNFHRVTQISMEDVDPDSFKSFVHYLYKGRLDPPMLQDGPGRYGRTLELLRMSHKYGHVDLFTKCQEILISLVNVENACEMFQVASEFELKDLEARALELMAAPNFYKIVQMDIPVDVIKSIAKKLSELTMEETTIGTGIE